jgi:predicted AAA+ superfamily ATPase
MMEKRVIKSLIIEKQNEIPQTELMPRTLELEDTCNYVFVGLRRSGKSYLRREKRNATNWEQAKTGKDRITTAIQQFPAAPGRKNETRTLLYIRFT